MDRFLVSIVMPMYNTRSYVADGINSVLRQDYANFELVVVDDGSTDGSHLVVERFHDPRIHLIRTVNHGANAARNVGIARSRGAFVTFLDSDDLLMPAALSSRMAGFERHDTECVFSRNIVSVEASQFKGIERLSELKCSHGIDQTWTAECLINQLVDRRFFIGVCCMIVRREALLASGGFDESIIVAQDVEFLPRLLLACHTLVETFELCQVYRRVPNSLSVVDLRRKAAGKLRAVRQSHRNLAPYLAGREASVAQTLFDVCVHVYPYWTGEHRLAMAEARRLRGDEPFDLGGVGGPRAQAVARLLGWRAGRLATFASSFLRQSLRRPRAPRSLRQRG